MRRREFISLLGGAAAAWPLAAHAQQRGVPVVGFLDGGSLEPRRGIIAAFLQGLNDTGYAEGRNVAIEYRWADGRYELLPALAAELAARRVAVIATGGGDPSVLAAKAATTTIPIVFTMGNDPVKLGLVASLNHPGGNITGVVQFASPLTAKRVEVLLELVPGAKSIGVLINPKNANADLSTRDTTAAAAAVGREIHVLHATGEADFTAAFETISRLKLDVLMVMPDVFFTGQRLQLTSLAARFAVPAIFYDREFVTSGGLISYGTSLANSYRQAGIYTGKILDGEKPADLPVMQPTKFELVINLKTAKALGLTVPPSLLALADEVIE
jgi:putative tryptophan/tyrosine transport system substrate-binding protein